MGNHELEETRFDAGAAHVLEGFSRRVSRRSMISRLGKAALTALGVSVVPLLPLDRIMRTAEAQGTDCNLWQLCGIWGYRCTRCRCCEGTQQVCPRCMYEGHFWATCCPMRSSDGTFLGKYMTVKYTDCCGQQGSVSVNGDANSCDGGEFCHGNNFDPPVRQDSWCAPAPGPYHCTHFTVFSECTPV
jgi:hypothetical protein